MNMEGFHKGLYYTISNYISGDYKRFSFSIMDYGIITKRQIILEKEIMQEEITRQHVINYIDSYLNKRNQDTIDLNHYQFMLEVEQHDN